MRTDRLTHPVTTITIIGIIGFLLFFAVALAETKNWSDEGVVAKDGKKYPHPHTLHLEALSERTADFSVDEIKDWPAFLQSLKGKFNILPFSAGAEMTIRDFKPAILNSDEKTMVVNEINRLLTDDKFISRVKGLVAFSRDTEKTEAEYNKTRSKEDLRWLNRNIINDMFPQTLRIGKVKELRKMTCATCHEAWGKEEFKEINETVVMECFSKALAGEKGMEECIEKAKLLKESRIEDPGPLKQFIQRSDTKGDIEFFVGVRPENPYTFKPLLKRLVCIECHSRERKVDKVMGRDGKVKEISIFYGAGSEKRHEH